jgi:hypothetical protein
MTALSKYWQTKRNEDEGIGDGHRQGRLDGFFGFYGQGHC